MTICQLKDPIKAEAEARICRVTEGKWKKKQLS